MEAALNDEMIDTILDLLESKLEEDWGLSYLMRLVKIQDTLKEIQTAREVEEC